MVFWFVCIYMRVSSPLFELRHACFFFFFFFFFFFVVVVVVAVLLFRHEDSPRAILHVCKQPEHLPVAYVISILFTCTDYYSRT